MSALGTVSAPRDVQTVRAPGDVRVLSGGQGVGFPPFPTPTLTKSVGFTGLGTLSVALEIEAYATALFAGTGTLTAAAAAVLDAAFSGAGTLSAPVAIPVVAAFGGEGSTVGAVAIPRTANFAGTGTLAASTSFEASVAADFGATGTLSAFIIGGEVSVSANFNGAGTLTSTSSVTALVTAGLTGSGTLSGVGYSWSPFGASGSGTLSATTVVALPANFTGSGTLSAVLAGSLMGMNKSGTQVIPSTSTMTKLTGWTARSGFGSTVITSDGLVMNGTLTSVTVKFKATILNNFGTRRHQLYLNGSPVGSDVAAGAEGSAVLSLVAGDRLELYARTSSTSGDTVQSGSTNTYIYLE
jgi:hypothetical protein